MPRSFDDERDQRIAERKARWQEERRDRSFVLGGEVFEYAQIVPVDVADAVLEAMEGTNDQALRRVIASIPRLLELGDPSEATLERWERAKSKVEYEDALKVCYWIVGEVTRRPTQAPSSSGERRETNGAGSTEISSSPPVVSAASEH